MSPLLQRRTPTPTATACPGLAWPGPRFLCARLSRSFRCGFLAALLGPKATGLLGHAGMQSRRTHGATRGVGAAERASLFLRVRAAPPRHPPLLRPTVLVVLRALACDDGPDLPSTPIGAPSVHARLSQCPHTPHRTSLPHTSTSPNYVHHCFSPAAPPLLIDSNLAFWRGFPAVQQRKWYRVHPLQRPR